jgi:hypothetical protein
MYGANSVIGKQKLTVTNDLENVVLTINLSNMCKHKCKNVCIYVCKHESKHE